MLRLIFAAWALVAMTVPSLAQNAIVSLPPPDAATGVTSDQPDASASDEEPAGAAPCGGETITIASMQWPSAQLLAAIHARLIKQNFGCDVEIVPGDLAATASSMGSNGQPAVAPEMWITRVADVWNAALKGDNVRQAGTTYSDPVFEGWFIPDYVAAAHPDIRCTSFDLPEVVPIATRSIAQAGLGDRVAAVGGDFFTDPLPKADVITMGMILHDWNLEKKKGLIRKAYEALPEGGAFVVVEALIDDARRKNAFGLLMSLNMLIELGDAFDYSGADFAGWCREAGFRHFEVIPLAGPASAAVAYK